MCSPFQLLQWLIVFLFPFSCWELSPNFQWDRGEACSSSPLIPSVTAVGQRNNQTRVRWKAEEWSQYYLSREARTICEPSYDSLPPSCLLSLSTGGCESFEKPHRTQACRRLRLPQKVQWDERPEFVFHTELEKTGKRIATCFSVSPTGFLFVPFLSRDSRLGFSNKRVPGRCHTA